MVAPQLTGSPCLNKSSCFFNDLYVCPSSNTRKVRGLVLAKLRGAVPAGNVRAHHQLPRAAPALQAAVPSPSERAAAALSRQSRIRVRLPSLWGQDSAGTLTVAPMVISVQLSRLGLSWGRYTASGKTPFDNPSSFSINNLSPF